MRINYLARHGTGDRIKNLLSYLLGTEQFSNMSSQVLEPRMPNLSNFCAVRNPGKFFSMMNVVIFFFPSDSSAFFVLA